jgi:hypothetical protein
MFLQFTFSVVFFIPHASELPDNMLDWLTGPPGWTQDEQCCNNKKLTLFSLLSTLVLFWGCGELELFLSDDLPFSSAIPQTEVSSLAVNPLFFLCRLLIAGDLCKLKHVEFSDLQSRALAQIFLRPDASLNVLLQLGDMNQWIFQFLLLLPVESISFWP